MRREKIRKIMMLFMLGMLIVSSSASAELKIESVYPSAGLLNQDLEITLTGTGFDENTRVLAHLNAQQIIGWADTPGYTVDVAVSGSAAYLADGESGLKIIDIANPSNPMLIKHLPSAGKYNCRVEVADNIVYMAKWGKGLSLIDVSDPYNPIPKGSVTDIPGLMSYVSDVKVTGNIAYTVNLSGLQVIDVSEPDSPALIGSVNTPGFAFSLTVTEDIAYVADALGGLQIIDVSNPSAPKIIAATGATDSLYASNLALGLTVAGNLAYVADMQGLKIIDISDPRNPVLKGSVDTPGWAFGVTVVGNIAYVSDVGTLPPMAQESIGGFLGDNQLNNSSLHIINISDPSNPFIMGSAEIPGEAFGLAVSGNTAYVANGFNGLIIISLPTEIVPTSVEDTSISFILPAPATEGAYSLTVFNDKEYDQSIDAVTFRDEADSDDSEETNETGEEPDEETYRFERAWPVLLQPWYFNVPNDVAVDHDDFVYVVDMENYCIQKFTANGELVVKWGFKGVGNGYFNCPGGIAVDNRGGVYVTDIYSNCVQKFTANGQLVNKWGSSGSEDGHFLWPLGIAVDSSGFVYVGDLGNSRIQKFDSDGKFISKWGSRGSGSGQFISPKGIAADSKGFIYAADLYNNRIQKFSSDGEFKAEWGSGIEGFMPEGIAIDSNGDFYVTDSNNICVWKFSPEGEEVTQWGTKGSSNGAFKRPYGIAADSRDFVYVADAYDNNRIQKFKSDGQFITKWGAQDNDAGHFNHPHGITTDREGFIYAADSRNHRIQKFTGDGQFLTQWGAYGSADGEFDTPIALAIDSEGSVYVADSENHRIQKFDSDGSFVTKWGSYGSGDGQFNHPCAIGIDSQNFVYVTDWNHRVQVFKASGEFQTKWGSHGTEDGQFERPCGIAIDSRDAVYVADTWNHRIQKFESGGSDYAFVTKWGSPGNGNGNLELPCNIAVDSQDNLYVAEKGNHRIQKFASDAQFITKFGEFGSGAGQLKDPYSVCVNANGAVYVSDTDNNRIQVFKKTIWTGGKAVIVAGTTGLNDNLWDATKMNANFVYRTLNYQGFAKEDIYYLSSDTEVDLDSNGEPDDVKPVTNEVLKEAITIWAKGSDGLTLYIVDHGDEGTFVMSDKDTLAASDLASWLNQAEISGKTIVVYDACYSGTFLAPLSADNQRIIMTSASPKQKAFFPRQGSVSFSNYFWTHIFNGFDVNEAFSRSDDGMSTYQNPLMDADGNKTANEKDDFTITQGIYIGNGTVIQGDGPVIGSVSREQSISGASSATLEAFDVTDDDGIAHVWAVILPPGYNREISDGTVKGTVKDLPSVDLMPVGDNKYAGTYDGFNVDEKTGDYQIVIYARDSVGNISVPKLTAVSVKNPLRRRAVLVVGVSQSDDLWPVMEKNVRSAYTALRVQGYPDDDIYLMSEASISDVPVNPIEPTLSNLTHALGAWAEENTQDMMLYMIGRGFDGVFYINKNETLTAAQLDTYLDSLQANISGTIAVVYDACRSGSFISALTPPQGKNRIVICSAKENQPAAFIPDGYLSFSSLFWREILHGECVMMAFNKAKDDIFYLTGERQVSYIDDNGNGVPNESAYEGTLAGEYDIGIGVLLADNTPDAETFSADQILQGARSAKIWVENVSGAYKVLAIIAPPEDLSADMDKACDFNLVTLELNEADEGRYETVYDHFEISGTYDIKFCNIDSDGRISTLTSAKITKQSGNDIYEPDNELAQASIIVINDASQKHNFYEPEDADWLKFYGLSGTTYEIKASKMAENCNVIIELYDSDGETKLREQNTLGYPRADEILTWDCDYDGLYYVKLIQADPNASGDGTEYEIEIYKPDAPDYGWVQGKVTDSVTGESVLAHVASNELSCDSMDSVLNGEWDYRISCTEGLVSLRAEAACYETFEDSVSVSKKKTVLLDISMVPVKADTNGDDVIDLKDAIMVLKIIAGTAEPSVLICKPSDVNEDGRIGLEEVAYILKMIAK